MTDQKSAYPTDLIAFVDAAIADAAAPIWDPAHADDPVTQVRQSISLAAVEAVHAWYRDQAETVSDADLERAYQETMELAFDDGAKAHEVHRQALRAVRDLVRGNGL